MRPEDKPRTLLFVDMLGFAELTRHNPTRLLDWGPDASGVTGTSSTDLQSRIARFQGILDGMLQQERFNGGVSAQVFSDCAYIDLDTSLRAVRLSAALMREFIANAIPVRMGLGRGTFYVFRYAIEHDGTDTITKALFAGTAVVNAHSAEHCGGKGCRIFVHPSVQADLDPQEPAPRFVLLPTPIGEVSSEVCYLLDEVFFVWPHEEAEDWKIVDSDLMILGELEGMSRDCIAESVRVHYTETFSAIERMRKAMGRGTTLEEAARNARREDADHRPDGLD